MNKSLGMPWLVIVEAPEDRLSEFGYTVCGFDSREQAERRMTVLRRLRRLCTGGRLDRWDECEMPDENIVFAGDIGGLHLYRNAASP